MCGRTACSLAAEQIRRACAYRDGRGRRRDPDWRDGDRNKYKPSFNKSPHSHCPVLVSRKHFHKDADSTEQLLAAMRWGLIPSWFRESDPSKMLYNTSNCRSDGMLHKNSYKDPFMKGQRCVVLADGFYEWQRQNGEKQPYFIYFPQTCEKEEEDGEEWKGRRLLTMAGLFDHWAPPGGGEDFYTYTVITVDASKAMDWIHDRMPAILDGEEAVRMWLDYGQVPAMEALKLIHPTERIALHPVSTVVNNSRNDFLDCIKPIELGVKKEVKPTASSKLMMNWLQNPSPKKEEASPGSQHTVKVETPKKSSVGLMQMWLQKTEEPSAKKLRTS
ncbi:abasic site processing protein HMCES [Chiloscyllium plagiosum]|uniref:abasic site processing protein HMCES n=1 Tax=Chiloscyllium plagiosum TaxID=36176 RepID=UPI001CB7FFF6|nr:abasic site processing protein HMCES [Chiloscyllium plagiosum]XP_043563551.1 abasic site processing protein HMCES [Chiloscyllium plagiosum]XP_043563552.1 abasic site processing protein HMCES [Chiloscyllium plagiosum]XP_043563553.1 abasic site processing protein HMCES [Chiloscyllium plagiosum]XP_043563554.1 abasic site processing protein HMCES [Chiloscyllium plagiosum]